MKDAHGGDVEHPPLINTWETDGREQFRYAVEALDPESVEIDPLAHL